MYNVCVSASSIFPNNAKLWRFQTIKVMKASRGGILSNRKLTFTNQITKENSSCSSLNQNSDGSIDLLPSHCLVKVMCQKLSFYFWQTLFIQESCVLKWLSNHYFKSNIEAEQKFENQKLISNIGNSWRAITIQQDSKELSTNFPGIANRHFDYLTIGRKFRQYLMKS